MAKSEMWMRRCTGYDCMQLFNGFFDCSTLTQREDFHPLLLCVNVQRHGRGRQRLQSPRHAQDILLGTLTMWCMRAASCGRS